MKRQTADVVEDLESTVTKKASKNGAICKDVAVSHVEDNLLQREPRRTKSFRYGREGEIHIMRDGESSQALEREFIGYSSKGMGPEQGACSLRQRLRDPSRPSFGCLP